MENEIQLFVITYPLYTDMAHAVERSLEGMGYKFVASMWSTQGRLNTKGSEFKLIWGHAENTQGVGSL